MYKVVVSQLFTVVLQATSKLGTMARTASMRGALLPGYDALDSILVPLYWTFLSALIFNALYPSVLLHVSSVRRQRNTAAACAARPPVLRRVCGELSPARHTVSRAPLRTITSRLSTRFSTSTASHAHSRESRRAGARPPFRTRHQKRSRSPREDTCVEARRRHDCLLRLPLRSAPSHSEQSAWSSRSRRRNTCTRSSSTSFVVRAYARMASCRAVRLLSTWARLLLLYASAASLPFLTACSPAAALSSAHCFG